MASRAEHPKAGARSPIVRPPPSATRRSRITPFRMPDRAACAPCSTYPLVENIEDALVVGQSVIYVEVKDDRIQGPAGDQDLQLRQERLGPGRTSS